MDLSVSNALSLAVEKLEDKTKLEIFFYFLKPKSADLAVLKLILTCEFAMFFMEKHRLSLPFTDQNYYHQVLFFLLTLYVFLM